MKVIISEGEWYPVYSVYEDDGDYGVKIEVSEEKYQAWKREFDRFEKLQIKLGRIYAANESY